MPDIFILRLQGVLQSWGGHTLEDFRPTQLFPTRSALAGLLGACLGVRRKERERLSAVAEGFAYCARLDRSERPLVRLSDFHTIKEARKVDGKVDKNPVVSRREYLCDAKFTVALSIKPSFPYSADSLKEALRAPVFTPFLGRRSCPPSHPLFESVVSAPTLREALKSAPPGAGVLYSSRLRMDAAAAVNPYEVHRLLWTAFPGMPDTGRPYLFHRRRGRANAAREVLMLSTKRPSPPGDARLALLECRSVAPSFREGQRLKFELEANPVKRLEPSRARVPLIRDEERLAWLDRRLAGAAEIENARVVSAERLYFRKPGMPPGKIEAVVFSGVLRIRDATRLLETFRKGIGPAKSFGCGLLLLAKV